ncbi:MAG: oligosaccharide flippase family protein, partial [Gemmiger sp.]
MQVKLYIKNAALLTVSGFVLRILGMAFRVYVAGRLGSEGMGLYQLILAVYMVFVSLATAGINTASTRLAAQNLARGRGLAKTARSLVCTAMLLGTTAMVAQAALAGPVAHWLLHDSRAELGLRVLSLSLPFMAAAGALRGCFLAARRVRPNVTAQLVEQCVRMGVVFLTIRYFVHWGAGYACAAVLLGNTVSEAVSCGIMILYARREPVFRPLPKDVGVPYTRRELWGIALPVEGSRLLASALQAAESTLIPYCLALYLGDRAEAVSQYGALKGMAIPLIFFPFSILSALSGLLMPEITRAHTRKDTAGLARLIDSMMTITGLMSVFAGLGFVLFGRQAAMLLYHDAQVGSYVHALGFVAPFM